MYLRSLEVSYVFAKMSQVQLKRSNQLQSMREGKNGVLNSRETIRL